MRRSSHKAVILVLALNAQNALRRLSIECTMFGMDLTSYLSQKGITAVALGEKLGVSHSTILRWADGKVPVPAERVAAVSRATGIPAATLRPDLAAVFAEPATV